MSIRWSFVCIAAFLTAAANTGYADVIQIDVEASGATREEAITASLTSAIEQVTGVSVKSASVSIQKYESTSSSTTTINLSEASQKDIRKASGGVVQNYRVLKMDPENSHYVAKVSVTVEVFEPVGINPDSRRKVAVLGFSGDGGNPHSLGEVFRQKLVNYLTQTRRFAVLDRSNVEAFNDEKSFLQSDNVPITERVKLGQALGADYVIVGKLRNTATRTVDQEIAITGQRQRRFEATGEADYSVLDIATRQVKWAGSIHTKAASLDEGPDSGMSALLEQLAALAGDNITQNIYPMRIIKAEDPDDLVINQGGITVTPGERLQAMRLGSDLVDPYTKESLGRKETPIAVIEITRVTAKLSYGKLVSGDTSQNLMDSVLRRNTGQDAKRDDAHAVSPILKLPFDK